jgi:hypothetical protein
VKTAAAFAFNPIALGRGHTLFEDSKDRVPLRLDNVRQFNSGNVLLTYRPAPETGPKAAPVLDTQPRQA